MPPSNTPAKAATNTPLWLLLGFLGIVIATSIGGAIWNAREEKFREDVAAASEKAADQELTESAWREADAALAKALADPRLQRLTKTEQSEAYLGAAWGAINLDDYPRAETLTLSANRIDPDNARTWFLLTQVQNRNHKPDAAARTLATYLRRWPEKTGAAESVILRTINDLEPGSAGGKLLLEHLFEQDWTSDDSRASQPWRLLALERARGGDRKGASAALARVKNTGTIVHVRSDKRFDGLYDRDSPAFDAVAAGQHRLALLNDKVEADPDDLDSVLSLTHMLLLLGKDEAVVELTEDYLPEVEKPTIEDEDDDLPAIIENRATAMMHLGKVSAAVSTLEMAASIKGDDDKPNSNQVLDLADLYCSLRQPDKALEVANRLTPDDLSEHGLMVQKYIEHCGAWLRNDFAGADRALAYMREHRKDAEEILMWALIRQDSADEAARELLANLRSEKTRSQVLYQAQDFVAPKAQAEGALELDLRWRALLQREDVRAEIDALGRIESYGLHRY